LAKGLFQITVAHRVRQVAHVKLVAHERDSYKHINEAMGSQGTTPEKKAGARN
jgi:hypothetical protein